MITLIHLQSQHQNLSNSISSHQIWPRGTFTSSQICLGGERILSNEEVIAEAGTYFSRFDNKHFQMGSKLKHRWSKCIIEQL